MSRVLETLLVCYASAPGNTGFSILKPTTSKPVSQANIRVEVITAIICKPRKVHCFSGPATPSSEWEGCGNGKPIPGAAKHDNH